MRTALTQGANFWNGGQFYGTPEHNSLHLLSSYFNKYPEDAEKVVISIKGGVTNMTPDGSEAGLRASVDGCLELLKGKKFLDIFEMARVDPNVPIETSMGVLASYVKEGKLGGISLSEVKAESIRRAHKVHPICAVEVEFSLWSTDILKNGVATTCAELGIPVVAYSPLGRGFLTGQIKSPNDIPQGDLRRHFPRFQPEVFDKNIELVRDLEKQAGKKGCTPAQLALAWVKQMSARPGMPLFIPIPGATTEERILENMKEVELTDAEMKVIDEILKDAVVEGHRYPEMAQAHLEG